MSYKFDKVKILVVDDMVPILTIIQSILKILGFKEVFTAQNGKEAFEILCKEDPDIVVTDWLMSPIDGLELAQKIRTDPAAPNPYVPILMISGFSIQKRIEKARDYGITDFLAKPFSAKDLFTRIERIIEKPRQFVDTNEFFGPDRRNKRVENVYTGANRRGDEDYDDKKTTEQERDNAASLLRQLKKDLDKIKKDETKKK